MYIQKLILIMCLFMFSKYETSFISLFISEFCSYLSFIISRVTSYYIQYVKFNLLLTWCNNLLSYKCARRALLHNLFETTCVNILEKRNSMLCLNSSSFINERNSSKFLFRLLKGDVTFSSSLFTMDGFRLITNNRTGKKGGGVGFYVSQNLNCELLKDFSIMSETFESIFIEIKAPNKRNIIVGEIYRPPNANAIDFGEHVHGLLSNRYFDNKTCFIMGDFN